MKNMCALCTVRTDCRELCPEAAAYADQDHVREHPRLRMVDPVSFDYALRSAPTDPVAGLRWTGLYCREIENSELGEEEWMLVEASGLTPRQKEALYLRYWAGFSVVRVGEVLGIARQVAAAHIAKAARRVAEKVRPSAPDRIAVESFMNRMKRIVDDRDAF